MLNNETKRYIRAYKQEEEERLVEYFAKTKNITYLKPIGVVVHASAIQLIDEAVARKNNFAVYKITNAELFVATRNYNLEKIKPFLSEFEKKYTINYALASSHTLKNMWDVYSEIRTTSKTVRGVIKIDNEELEERVAEIKSLAEAIQVLKDASKEKTFTVSNSIEYALTLATAIKSSDIHIEPIKNGGVIRFRIDGVLNNVFEYTYTEYRSLLTRIKLVAGMKISVKNIAQDGSFVFNFKNRQIAIRASVIPEGKDESMVLRILDTENVLHSLESLGLHPSTLSVFKKQIAKPNGMILTTGPTSSGKTTTLYSCLNYIKTPEKKIITLEDPIEYRLDGITQTQIEEGYSFAQGLRAILRQDPEIILVGEIRDEEVLRTAINASLTGHLVFSTLHTNDAVGALTRMSQMGADVTNLSNAVNLIMAQRLIRKLCLECAKKRKMTAEEKKAIKQEVYKLPETYKKEFDLENISEENKTGCSKCTGGFKGRIGTYEIFVVDRDIEIALAQKKSLVEIQDIIYQKGNISMLQDGLIKVLDGVSALSELSRVFGVKF